MSHNMNRELHILVTGGSGFMGSHFIDHILRTHPYLRVLNLDKRPIDQHPDHLTQWTQDSRYTVIEGDITNRDQVENIVKTQVIDTVVNFAMITGRNRGLQDPLQGVTVNVSGVASLLNVVEKYGVRLIQIGTDQVYGSLETGLASNSTPMNPTSHYAAEKAAADMLCYASHKAHGSDVIMTHACNLLGSYQHPNELLPQLLTNAIDDIPLTIWGDGLQQRQWLFIKDYVRAIELITLEGISGNTYNIGSEEEKTILELAHLIQATTFKTSLPILHSDPPYVYDRRHAVDWVDVAKLGWKPLYTLEDGLSQITQWYKEYRSWWEPIKVQGKTL